MTSPPKTKSRKSKSKAKNTPSPSLHQQPSSTHQQQYKHYGGSNGGVSTRQLFSRSMWLCPAERIGFTLFSEMTICVTNGGYKLKDIYVNNMLHYFFHWRQYA
ncbi:hypothetical protein LXL04_035010 [Taraxacum kok-saghyz]